MPPDALLLLIVLGLIVILGLIVLLRNPSKLPNIIFAIFCTNIIFWTLFNYLSDHAQANNLLFTRLTVLFGSLIATSLVCLSYVFPKKTRTAFWTRVVILVLTLVNAVFSLSSLYVSSVSMTSSGANLNVGPLYALFIAYMVSFVAWSVHNFLRQLKTARHIARSQIKLFMFAFLIYGVFAIGANMVLPLMVNDWSSSRYGPVFTVPFVAITAYAIVKHHLFDLRAVIARILAYVVTLVIIVGIYSLLVVGVIAQVISLDHLSATQLLVLAAPTIICTLTFPYVKSVVDKATARVFYRKMYSIRDVLDKLSDALISENDVQKLIHASVRILSSALHPASVYVVIFDTDMRIFKDYSVNRTAPHQLAFDIPTLSKQKDPVINRDDHENDRIDAAMGELDADVALRLHKGDKLIGFILFGNKKSGSPFTTQDIKLLRVAANNLSVALDNAQQYEQISHFADTLKIEVTHATEKLRHANEKLKTLDKLKDDFISMASHQFRTPAGSVRQALHMIHDPKLTQKDREEMLLLAEANSEQLVSVVNTMLNISRIEAGKFIIDKSLTNLTELVDKVMLATSIVADQKRITLDFVRPEHDIVLIVDRAKINEAMKNYVENAIKYSPDGSTIKIALRDDGNDLRFEVSDSGMGVPQNERKNLFGKFYRAQNARQEQPDGNGIGLYVVRQIAEAHGGTAYYEPLEPGSLFGFSLPLQTL